MNNNKQISKKFFIFASFFALIFLFTLGTYLGLQNEKSNSHKKDASGTFNKDSNGFFYLNEDFKQNDPYITRNPNLKTMLVGPIISNLDPSRGQADAKVNLVYFSDFKCDYCFEQEKILTQVEAEYKGKIRMIWKDYPVDDLDSVSFQASLAARCAQDQDSFWEYHDLLFENNKNLNSETFSELAKTLKLDMDVFDKCLTNKAGKTRVKDNITEANALEIVGVPFMYVNSQEVMGEITYKDLKQIIELELKD